MATYTGVQFFRGHGVYDKASLGTQEIHFGRKTNEITKFSILDEKTKFTILDEIWTKNGQLMAEKVVRFFHIHWRYHNAFTVGLKERMPRIIGMRMD